MKRCDLRAIKTVSRNRMPGYEDAIIKAGRIDGNCVILDDDVYEDISKRFRVNGGPRLMTKVGNLAKAIRDIAKDRFRLASSSQIIQREQGCSTCTHWKSSGNFGMGKCALCGCTRAKLKFAAMRCPVGRWSEIKEEQKPVRIHSNTPEDLIREHYRSRVQFQRRRIPDLRGVALTNIQNGLGDTVIMSDVAWRSHLRGDDIHVWSRSKHVLPIQQFNPQLKTIPRQPSQSVWDLYSKHDLGNGHLIQRLARAWGLPVEVKPKPKLFAEVEKVHGRVILHFEPGVHARTQRQMYHAKARELYPENRKVIENFIRDRQDLHFVQVGSNESIRIEGADHRLGCPLERTIRLIASAEWFLGIISGPMHVAAAFGVKNVVVVNFPRPDMIYLPTLVATGQVEEEWFYPQDVHLHQDTSGPLVPQFNARTLRQAFSGEVYPYWRDDWLPLIYGDSN